MESALEDTICAIATPVGEGGIGVVRISGRSAIEVAAQVVRLRSGKPLPAVECRRLYLADILEPDPTVSESISKRPPLLPPPVPIDEAFVVVMRGPRSYTGEDVIEIQCHGGAMVLRMLCDALCRQGARMASPGEFTKRAFLNGRLDLTQAEAVLDTIKAKTAASLKLAQSQLRGSLSARIEKIRQALVHALAEVEAGIDFVEEDLTFVRQDELRALLRATSCHIEEFLHRANEGRIWREGALVAIIGRPNVGKSSLMNEFLQSDRAIVTSIPGTTRDVLEESVSMRGVWVRLVDTAGLRTSHDPIEVEGMRRSRAIRDDADLVLLVLDGSEPLTAEDLELLGAVQNHACIVAVNKADLIPQIDRQALSDLTGNRCPVVDLSVKTGLGMDRLRDCIGERLTPEALESREDMVAVNVRHATALRRAKEALDHAAESVRESLSPEFVAVDLRVAADALGEITGAISTDEVLERVFSQFCIGK